MDFDLQDLAPDLPQGLAQGLLLVGEDEGGCTAEADLAVLGSLKISTELVSLTFTISGSSCSTGVERTPHNREVVGSNSPGCRAFWLFSIPSVVSPWSLPSQRCNTTDIPLK